MQPVFFELFPSNDRNGFLEDCSTTVIDKTDGTDPSRREENWRKFEDCYSLWGEHDRLIVYLGKFLNLQDFVFFFVYIVVVTYFIISILLFRIGLLKVVSTFLLLQRFYRGIIVASCAQCVCNFVFLFFSLL